MTAGVVEKAGGGLSVFITQVLKKCENCADTLVKAVSRPEVFSGDAPELIVFSAVAYSGKRPIFPDSVLIIPEKDAKEIAVARVVYTYGMGSTDDVTYSSIDGSKKVVSLQNEMTALTGKTVESQDIPVTQPGEISSDELLAAMAALIILGVPPEKLSSAL